MANTGTFRSAINGFNRQDVLDYLESASQRYELLKKERNELDRIRTEQQARLKELDAVQEEADAAREQAARETAEALEQLQASQAECESLRAALEDMTAQRDAALARPAEDPAVAEALRGEIETLKSELAQLKESQADTLSKAAEYDSMRDRIATLELNASRRAAEIEQTAQTEAQALLLRMEEKAREIKARAEQEAEAILSKAKQEDAEFGARREESFRSFRESLLGAATDTETSTGLLSRELESLSGKMKGIISALTETARRFAASSAPDAGEADAEAESAAEDCCGGDAPAAAACSCGQETGAEEPCCSEGTDDNAAGEHQCHE